ncbi:MAG: site-specific integrase [Terriglobus roseus]|nr:site-specific integrase [Terriglobus roseus]
MSEWSRLGGSTVASIQKRSNDTWRARYRDSAGKEYARHFARKVDAQAWLDEVTTAVRTGTYVDPLRSRTLVGTLADQWFAGKVALKPTTRALYESVLVNHVRPRWQDVPLTSVEYGQVQTWVAQLVESGMSPGHVRKVHGVLSGVLALAVRDRRLPANPALGVELPRMREQARRYLTATQVEELASAAGEGRTAVLVLSYCGLRWSELAALRVGRLDLLRRRLLVAEAMTEVNGGRLVWGTPKTHESRSVPIPRLVVDELAPRVQNKRRDDLVFTTSSGAPLRNRNARRDWFDAAVAKIGEPDLTPHELRHTAASLAVSAGANVKAVQRMLGHASAAMTLDRYADLFDDDLDAVADRLDAVARRARELLADSLRTGDGLIMLPKEA